MGTEKISVGRGRGNWIGGAIDEKGGFDHRLCLAGSVRLCGLGVLDDAGVGNLRSRERLFAALVGDFDGRAVGDADNGCLVP